MEAHYYILPDGTTALTMKEGRLRIGKGCDAFRSLERKGIIKKITYTHKLHSDGTTSLNK
jgi:hypothetical protein